MTTETSNARGPEYVTEMGEAADRYIRGLCVMADGTYALRPPALPGTFRWEDLYNAMLAAAPPPAAARGGVRGLVAKWRAEANAIGDKDAFDEGLAAGCRVSADELEAALAAEGVQAGESVTLDAYLHVTRLYAEVSQRIADLEMALSQQPEARGVVDGAMVERVLHTRVPGGSEVWHWIEGGGVEVAPAHRRIAEVVIKAYIEQTTGKPIHQQEHEAALTGERNA